MSYLEPANPSDFHAKVCWLFVFSSLLGKNSQPEGRSNEAYTQECFTEVSNREMNMFLKGGVCEY